jgi:colicin import membrane protein
MITITELLERAKRAIETGQNSLRDAAEDIADAREQGATQRQIADAVGKSAAWVNQLLKWRKSGYQDATAFGPQARATRQRAGRVQSPEQKPATTSEQAQAAAARARAETAKAEAAKAKADAQKAKAEAAKAKADARSARAKAKARADSFSWDESGGETQEKAIRSGPRELLVKALGMLGSDQAGERANAALVVEKQRAKLGMTWDELIIPADEAVVEERAGSQHPH